MNTSNAQSPISIEFGLIIPCLAVANQKQAFAAIAKSVAASIGINEKILCDRFVEKEKSNPSANGNGLAIMHLQMSGLQKNLNVFVRMKNAIAMNTPDNKNVDIFCLILTPEREGSSYLQTIARLSRTLRDGDLCKKIRGAVDEKEIKAIFNPSPSKKIAA